MRILHTSDLHLQKGNPRTIDALKQILSTAEDRDVDLVTIGGDLFHSEEDAEVLRPQLREIFTDNNFEVLAIPGNHDQEAYSRNLDFGPDLRIATRRPFETYERDEEFSIVAVPFTNELTSELYNELREASEEISGGVLLLHCTLDIECSSQDFGEEEVWAYCPVNRSTLSDLGFNYVLAGHFHTSLNVRELENGGKFVYPGSPISLGWKELGKRQAVLIDTDDETLKGIHLNTFYLDKFEKTVRPGGEDEFIGEVEEWVGERSEDDCQLKIIPRGHIKTDETEFRESLEEHCGGAEVSHEEYKNVEVVLEHPLFQRFVEELESREDIENKEAIEIKAVEAMSRLIASKELRT